MSVNEGKQHQPLLHVLCSKITGLNDDALVPYYKVASLILSSSVHSSTEDDEFEVVERIKRKLVRQKGAKDAAIFAEQYRSLQNKSVLRNRKAILQLLYKLSGDGSKKNVTSGRSTFYQGLASGLATSTPFVGRGQAPTSSDSTQSMTQIYHSGGSRSAGSSGISSVQASFNSTDPSPVPQSIHPSMLHTMNTIGGSSTMRPPMSTGQRVLRLLRPDNDTLPHFPTPSESATRLGSTPSERARSSALRVQRADKSSELSEAVLIREIVYVLQGIEGKYIKYDVTKEAFSIDSKCEVPKAMRKMIAKLAECGWLFNKVRKYADSRSTDRAFGLVGQSFCTALHEELAEYYRLLSVLEAQLQQQEDDALDDLSVRLSLRRLLVWTMGPMTRLRTLSALVDVCQGKKGGALASAIHSYIQHGDPSVRRLIKHTLAQVAQPIFITISRWQHDGVLDDTYHEFFVASDPTVKDDQLWHDKYSLRKSMIPSFLNAEQAKKILLTGKSINFLRQVCHDRTVIQTDHGEIIETSQVESMYTQDLDGVFQKSIDAIYKVTSSHLLEVLHSQYKLMDHLKAMRRYLLLGQGDFVHHLMDLLQKDLAKPAQTLYLHNVTGILETAVRGTNAQYDDAEILKRLDVRLLEVSPGDIGWDVFSLDYHVDGPIRTIFTPQCMVLYLRVFNFLWRAKRMEYILAGIWKEQMASTMLLRSIPEISPVLHKCHVLASQMVHFIQQVQYYINFEVLECSWDELLKCVCDAKDLDDIIAAHQVFLDTIVSRSLLDNQSQPILTQLRTIFDLILQFQNKQEAIYTTAADELLARKVFEDKKRKKTQEGEWGVTDAEQHEEDRRRSRFSHSMLADTKSQLQILANSYQNMVQQFLLMMAEQPDISLRFLSFCLDFNEYYRAKEPKLRHSLGYRRVAKSVA